MSVLDRGELESSPLADLHLIASELGLDGFRRLRKADLVEAILARGGGASADAPAADDADTADEAEAVAAAEPEGGEDRPRRRRSRRGGRGRSRAANGEEGTTDEDAGNDDGGRDAGAAETAVTGTIEVLGNGSAFLRVSPPEPSDDDVYVSAAQVRRCELVSGDEVAGPMRPPRRSERYPSLVRVETINGRAADEVAEGTPYDELPAAYPSQRLAFGSEDVTLKAIEWLTPIGRGSRVAITGPARAGKSEALRRLAEALATVEGLELSVVLAGARPEELTAWRSAEGLGDPVAALGLAASAEQQAQAIDRAVDSARRLATRGSDAVVLIDRLDGVAPAVARRALAAARDLVDGGSLTVIAVLEAPLGGETTVIALDRDLAATGRFPALDLVRSGTIRPELLVGDAGAEAIAQARAGALGT